MLQFIITRNTNLVIESQYIINHRKFSIRTFNNFLPYLDTTLIKQLCHTTLIKKGRVNL